MVDVDRVLHKIGAWHFPILILLVLRSWTASFHMLFLSFAAPSKQDHWCARPENFTDVYSVQKWKELAIPLEGDKYSRCLVRKFEEIGGELQFLNETQPCSSWEFDKTYYDWTLIREFGLVCDKSWYVSASQSAFMAGVMVGNVIFANLADRYGRRKSFLYSSLVMLASTSATVFSCKAFWIFNVARFGTSIAVGANQCVVTSIMMESLSTTKRMWAMLSMGTYTIGNMMMPWIAYVLPNWVHQQILYTAFTVPCLILWCFLPESPRWLLASGRVDEAEKALKNVVEKNQVKDVDVSAMFAEYRQQKSLQKETDVDQSSKTRPTYADLFRGPKLRLRTISLLIMYFASRVLMYHVTFFSARLGGNPFWGFFWVSALSIPAYGFALILLRYGKRRPSLFASSALTGVFVFALLPFGEESFLTRVVLCTLAKSMNAIGASVLTVFASECFPTVARAMGMGSAYTTSRLGAMLSPFFKELAEVGGKGASATVSAAIALLGAVFVFKLPETLDKPLPDLLSDVDPDVYAPVSSDPEGHEQDSDSSGAETKI